MGVPQDVGRVLIAAGILIALVGALLTVAGKLPLPGRLPGDLLIQRKSFTLYVPLASCLLLSLLLSLILWLMRR